ncbi:MAG TPA: hypothetical protein VN708_20610 [Terriglobales bacterium]|nr:hypothetical protein [Terriglobales bacterium]
MEESEDVKPKLDIVANHLQAYNFRTNGLDRSYGALTRTCLQGNDLHGTKYFS